MDNISGIYINREDKGTYYIRQVENKIVWFGESRLEQKYGSTIDAE